jgi:hypothetical protein
VLLVACGGGRPALAPLPVPSVATDRDAAVREVGEAIHATLVRGAPIELLVDDVGLRSLVDSQAATRYGALRAGVGARLEGLDLGLLSGTTFAGACLQGARLETHGGHVGLVADGWVVDRVLVVGLQPGGRRIASWVEGPFVRTTHGWLALDLAGVEAPRWEHADLELATCDMEVGLR